MVKHLFEHLSYFDTSILASFQYLSNDPKILLHSMTISFSSLCGDPAVYSF